MRELGYQVVDILVEHFESLREKPPAVTQTREALEARFREPLPEQPGDAREVVRYAVEHAFGNAMHVDHQRFFAFVPSPGNFVGAMADALASGFNPFVGTWLAGSGPAEVELVTIDWLREICGLPETAGGLFVSGGSMANLTALAVARHVRLGDDMTGARVYFSAETHSSVERALRVLGFRSEQLRKLPCDGDFRLAWRRSSARWRKTAAAGLRPFCVVANAGTTNTGAVDPLPGARALLPRARPVAARRRRVRRRRHAVRGRPRRAGRNRGSRFALARPAQVALPAHRDRLRARARPRMLRDTFRIMPAYLRDAHRLKEEVHLCDYGVQLTRGFRALKLWMSFKVFGAAAFRKAVARGFDNARAAEARLRRSRRWEIVARRKWRSWPSGIGAAKRSTAAWWAT